MEAYLTPRLGSKLDSNSLSTVLWRCPEFAPKSRLAPEQHGQAASLPGQSSINSADTVWDETAEHPKSWTMILTHGVKA